ncbi:MAG: HAMP domain-containing histidine kinase [Dactylosporangium sp.]|nr:HAMP domain-containing histidine kinase [Dactylosporangium sp.]NNJ60897.1 HAMP domain-containing histidine kinase [Dactylosporangium sp.]
MRRAGLRTRVTAGFAAGALALSTGMAVVSYQLIRRSLLVERESAAVRAAYYDATIVRAGLATGQPDIVDVLRTLDTGDKRRAVLYRDGGWYARNADVGVTTAVPNGLMRLVERGIPGIQRVRFDGRPAVVVGVPLSDSTAFYEVDSLRELDHTLRVLAIVLAIVAGTTIAAGAGLGSYAARYVLRPLMSVAAAAENIASGNLAARLDPAVEPDLARLTSSFNDMVDQLFERLERDRRFAADVSHELRSPLQTFAAAISVLTRRQDCLDSRTATAVGLIAQEADRFQVLVNDLLELARSDQPASREPVDVADLARQVCRSRGLAAELVKLEEPVEPTWHVDQYRIRQILGNLLDNAIRYGGGPTAVRLAQRAAVHIIEVDDEGPGVDPQDQKTIFDRFVRGRAAGSRGGGNGTGLGLALVAQYAVAHGGRALVEDRPGGGARFRVELPRIPS